MMVGREMRFDMNQYVGNPFQLLSDLEPHFSRNLVRTVDRHLWIDFQMQINVVLVLRAKHFSTAITPGTLAATRRISVRGLATATFCTLSSSHRSQAVPLRC